MCSPLAADCISPAPGYREAGFRNNTSGALGVVGREGSMWSASDYDTNGYGLRAVTDDVQASCEHIRVYGFQLRCLSE
ncbi:hypothetical protein [uncultured Rikenella sp.]|uniref:hypothetical protein n=1 Tax=uncultured Rikenella sp. TaxID=368003 RepID=UPI0025FB8C24|nr:hypothetical protein [uncultured Rikenella sp.]